MRPNHEEFAEGRAFGNYQIYIQRTRFIGWANIQYLASSKPAGSMRQAKVDAGRSGVLYTLNTWTFEVICLTAGFLPLKFYLS